MIIRKLIFICSLIGLISCSTPSIEAKKSDFRVISCNEPLEGRSAYTVLDNQRNTLGGWSHVEKDSDEYQTLKLNVEDYRITQEKHVSDKDCDGAKVQNGILVFKFSDWTRQHSNGFEALLDDKQIKFSDISHVVMDLRINRKSTLVPSRQELNEIYGELLSEEQFQTFDNGKVNLGITLFAEGALDQSTESLNAVTFIEIDQEQYFDQWLRVSLRVDQFELFKEKNYAGTPANYHQSLTSRVHGFRIDPENSQGNQVRNYLGDDWNNSIPETFKQMSVSLRRIEFISND